MEDGIVEDVDVNNLIDTGKVYYIPDREVVREKCETTKLRIVYDASSKTLGPSLSVWKESHVYCL